MCSMHGKQVHGKQLHTYMLRNKYNLAIHNFSEAQAGPSQASKINAKQKHLRCKKVRGQSEAALQIGTYDQKL